MGLNDIVSRNIYTSVNGNELPKGFEILELGLRDGCSMFYLKSRGTTIYTIKSHNPKKSLDEIYALAARQNSVPQQ